MQNGYSRIAIHLALLGDCHPSYFRGPHGLRLRIASPRELRAHPTSYKPHDRTNMPTLREGMPPVLYECPGHHDQEDLSMPIVTRSLALPALKSIDKFGIRFPTTAGVWCFYPVAGAVVSLSGSVGFLQDSRIRMDDNQYGRCFKLIQAYMGLYQYVSGQERNAVRPVNILSMIYR